MEKITVYEKVLKEVVLASNSRAELLQALLHHPQSPYLGHHDHPVSEHLEAVKRNVAEVSAIIDEILRGDLTDKERQQMEKYVAERTRYVSEGLQPACAAIADGDFERAGDIVFNKAMPLCAVTVHEAEAFGTVSLAEQTLYSLSLLFGASMVALGLWIALTAAG